MKTILKWVLFVLFALFSVVYLPNVAGFIALIAALFIIPIRQVQEIIERFIPYKWIRIIIIVILTIVFFASVPTDDSDVNSDTDPVTPSSDTNEVMESDSEPVVSAFVETEETQIETEAEAKAITYPAGQYKIGTDMQAGEYMLIQDSSFSAYFAISKDANDFDIIANDNFDGNSIVEVYDGEYLTMDRCYAVALDDAPTLSADDGYLGEGFYIVGVHIPAGEYKVEATERFEAYICVYSDLRRTDIITNEIFEGSRYVELSEGQYLEIERGRIYIGE